jgi:hypothetical protein
VSSTISSLAAAAERDFSAERARRDGRQMAEGIAGRRFGACQFHWREHAIPLLAILPQQAESRISPHNTPLSHARKESIISVLRGAADHRIFASRCAMDWPR